MQQKKERREARKLKIIPYAQHGSHGSLSIPVASTIVHLPQITAVNSMNGSLIIPSGSGSSGKATNHLTDSNDTSSSSSATATAIATTISSNSSEIENHLEEVDTVA